LYSYCSVMFVTLPSHQPSGQTFGDRTPRNLRSAGLEMICRSSLTARAPSSPKVLFGQFFPLAFFLDFRNSQPGRHTPKVSLFTSLRKTRRAMLLPGACHLVSKSFCTKSVGDQPSEGRPIPNSSPSRARYSSDEPNPRKRRIDLSPCVSVSPDCRRLLRAEGWVGTRVALLFDVVSTSPRFYR